ncbi:hypothetical protein GCM10022255_093880 [Dactylosporangium darangshiense]|uniref:Uncharacterized protein n=1 Tax=Dactylosporangium darangshiense TaxID=579108 RepID=A0ABP8DQ87_9ACTN
MTGSFTSGVCIARQGSAEAAAVMLRVDEEVGEHSAQRTGRGGAPAEDVAAPVAGHPDGTVA